MASPERSFFVRIFAIQLLFEFTIDWNLINHVYVVRDDKVGKGSQRMRKTSWPKRYIFQKIFVRNGNINSYAKKHDQKKSIIYVPVRVEIVLPFFILYFSAIFYMIGFALFCKSFVKGAKIFRFCKRFYLQKI